MPVQDKPRNNPRRSEREVGPEEDAWQYVALGVDHPHPADRERLLALSMAEGDLRQHPQPL